MAGMAAGPTPPPPAATHEDAAQLVQHPVLGRILQADQEGGGTSGACSRPQSAARAKLQQASTPAAAAACSPAPALTRRFRCFLGPRTILPAAAREREGGQGQRGARQAPPMRGRRLQGPRRSHPDGSTRPSVLVSRLPAARRSSKARAPIARGRHAPPPPSSACRQRCPGAWPPGAAASAPQPPMQTTALTCCVRNTPGSLCTMLACRKRTGAGAARATEPIAARPSTLFMRCLKAQLGLRSPFKPAQLPQLAGCKC